MVNNYRIMISHSWDYYEGYEKIRKWLKEFPYFNWTDLSVSINNPLEASSKEELRQKLYARICQCDCVLILSGMYVSYSEWIDYEINAAKVLGKPIIGIKPWGQERVPVAVQNKADIMVGWNVNSIIDAIRTYAK